MNRLTLLREILPDAVPTERTGPLAPTAAARIERFSAVRLHATVLRAVILDGRFEILGIAQPLFEIGPWIRHERSIVLGRDLI